MSFSIAQERQILPLSLRAPDGVETLRPPCVLVRDERPLGRGQDGSGHAAFWEARPLGTPVVQTALGGARFARDFPLPAEIGRLPAWRTQSIWRS